MICVLCLIPQYSLVSLQMFLSFETVDRITRGLWKRKKQRYFRQDYAFLNLKTPSKQQ